MNMHGTTRDTPPSSCNKSGNDYTVAFLIEAIKAGRPLVESGPPYSLDNAISPSFVYFLGCRDRVKVGFSVNPHGRANQAVTWCPYQVTIIGVLPGGPEEEAALHRALWPRHAHCEWFHLNDELEEILCKHTAAYDMPALELKDVRPRTGPKRTTPKFIQPSPRRGGVKKWNLFKGQI